MQTASHISLPPGFYWEAQLQLNSETEQIARLVWPSYLIDASDLPQTGVQVQVTAKVLAERWLVWGIRRSEDKKLVAYANAVLIPLDLSAKRFPDEGWEFALNALGSPENPNCVCLLVANVDPAFQKNGFARKLLDRAKELTLQLGFLDLVGPVRPSKKSLFPGLSMSEYLQKKNEQGDGFDPWLRQHLEGGAVIVNICDKSAVMKASLARWQQWLGPLVTTQKSIFISGGLVPLEIDESNQTATYCEPNVWVHYQLSPPLA